MKKIFATLMLAASLGLTACGNASMSSAKMKKNLEGKGYLPEVMTKVEAEARIKNVEYVVEITDAVYCEKEKEVLVAFFCANGNDASKFMEANIQAMYRFAEQYTEDPKTGAYNNVAYVGTANLIDAAGITLNF